MHRVVALLALVACGGGGDTTIDRTFDPCTLAISTDATGIRRTGIDDALALWGYPTVDAGEASDPVVVQFEDAALAFRGHYDDETGRVLVNLRITDPRTLAIVIAHELGHAFGLPHVSGRSSLMNPGNLTVEPTAEDHANVTALWGSCAAPLRSSRPR